MIGSDIIWLPETDSTNAFAMRLLSSERPPEGMVIASGFQSKGRGLDTNSWESEEGKNLLFSAIIYPSFLPADRQFTLNQAIALGIADFVAQKIQTETVQVKWPNDIYIGDRKVCGILIQNSILGSTLDYSVIGIGLNVNQSVFRSDAPNPVSMAMISGIQYEIKSVLNELCNCIDKRYTLLKRGDFVKIEKDYLQSLYRFGEWHPFLIKGSEHKAFISGTSEYGQLQLQGEKGEKWVCDLKEVKFLIG